MSVGYALADSANQLPVEADYGIKGEFNGSVMTVQVYNNTSKAIRITGSSLAALDIALDESEPSDLTYDIKRLETKNLLNGLYSITVDFSTGNSAVLYFLVNGEDYLFCRVLMANGTDFDSTHNINDIRKRRAHMYDLLDEWNVTADNSKSVDVIYYPQEDYYWYGEQIWRCDTDRWAELSDTLVEDDWSKERKAFVICDWLSQNIAYDRYVRDVIDHDRAEEAGDYMGSYSVWDLRSGVCRDFSNILTIMLREQDIPSDVVGDATHMWNVVYLNGKWMEVDLCLSQSMFVDNEDTTDRVESGNTYKRLLCMAGQDNRADTWGDSVHKLLYMGQEHFSDVGVG